MSLSTVVAEALERIKEITHSRGSDILQTSEMTRADRELLLRTHWLHEIMRGWYMLVRPDISKGDSGAWYANFWEFLRIYLTARFGDKYCLSAESSLEIHVGTTIIPRQIVVIVPRGGSKTYTLPYDTSILIYEDKKNFPEQRENIEGLQVMPIAYALCKMPATYFQKHPENTEIALRMLKTPAELMATK